MKLTYRGVHYDYAPRAIETMPEEAVGHAIKPTFNLSYRGATYSVDPNAASFAAAQPAIGPLMYRGVAYALNGWHESTVAAKTKKLPQWKKSVRTETINTHRESLNRQLQHRLQVAREKGDQNLVSLLERELQQLA